MSSIRIIVGVLGGYDGRRDNSKNVVFGVSVFCYIFVVLIFELVFEYEFFVFVLLR